MTISTSRSVAEAVAPGLGPAGRQLVDLVRSGGGKYDRDLVAGLGNFHGGLGRELGLASTCKTVVSALDRPRGPFPELLHAQFQPHAAHAAELVAAVFGSKFYTSRRPIFNRDPFRLFIFTTSADQN